MTKRGDRGRLPLMACPRCLWQNQQPNGDEQSAHTANPGCVLIGPVRIKVTDLRNDHVLTKPRIYDFATNYDADDESGGWQTVYPDFEDIETPGQLLAIADHYGAELDDAREELQRDEHLAELDEDDRAEIVREALTAWVQENHDEASIEPMMNYAYPLDSGHEWGGGPGFDAEAAQAQLMAWGGPLTIVTIDGDPFLALTGGGMDLSWEICEAYIILGYLPPAHYASDLPSYAGKEHTPETLAACGRSLELAANWATQARERFADRFDPARQAVTP